MRICEHCGKEVLTQEECEGAEIMPVMADDSSKGMKEEARPRDHKPKKKKDLN